MKKGILFQLVILEVQDLVVSLVSYLMRTVDGQMYAEHGSLVDWEAGSLG